MQKPPPKSSTSGPSKPSKSDRPGRGDRPDRSDRAARAGGPVKADRPVKPGKPSRPGQKRRDPRTRRDAQPAPSGAALERTLFRAWLDTGPIPPPIDRYLSYHVRPHKLPDADERKRLTQWMFATQRHATLALFCQWLLLDANRRDAFLTAPSDDVIRTFEAEIPTPQDFFGVLRSIDLDVFTGWIRHLSAFAPAPGYIARYGADIQAALARLGTPRATLMAASVPGWFADAWSRRVNMGGFDTTAFLAAQNTQPALWIRPKPDADVAAALTAEGFTVVAQDTALRVVGERPLFTTDTHRLGLFEIQDFGSQSAGARVDCRPGDFVWDACAGAGGKTLQIAANLREKGVVYASDVRADKLETLRQRTRRVGAPNVRTQPFDGLSLPEFPVEVRKHGGFDWVLVDAPCSSSGTWRRNPDARLRNAPNELRETTRIQRRLLAMVAEAVKPGGKLVYLTCSWLPDENEDVVVEFTEEHPDFELLSQGFHGCPAADADTLFGATWVRRPPR